MAAKAAPLFLAISEYCSESREALSHNRFYPPREPRDMLTSRGVRMEESSVPVWASALGWQCQALRHGRHGLILGRKNLDRLGVETEDAPGLKIHSNLKWGAEPARNLPCQSPSRLPTTSLQHSARLPLRPSVVQNATNYNTAPPTFKKTGGYLGSYSSFQIRSSVHARLAPLRGVSPRRRARTGLRRDAPPPR